MSSMEIIETKSPSEDAGKALCEALLEHKDRPVLLMLSGGSAFTILSFVSPEALGPHVTVTMLDERYSTDSKVNNFAQLEQTGFYKTCVEKDTHIISTKVLEGESIEGLRDRFDGTLHEWKEQNKDGVTIVTMGIGSDGHTAGIFPGEYGVDFNGSNWVVGYSVPKEVNEYTDRVTVTNTFLIECIQKAIVLVTGKEKAKIINALNMRAQHIDGGHGKPASVLLNMKEVALYTDLKL